jgi:hypothetical protein
VKATLAGIDEIRKVDPRARMVHVDPLLNIIAPAGKPQEEQNAANAHASQYEAWDMLAGLKNPELGGNAQYLDIIGLNFYAGNQWEHFGEGLAWHVKPRDPRWKPLHLMIEDVYARYKQPIILGETSHVGSGRAGWMREITDEVKLIDKDVPFQGICLYPIIDRQDWDNDQHWHNGGLYDYDHLPDGTLKRVMNKDYAVEIQRGQKLLAPFPP